MANITEKLEDVPDYCECGAELDVFGSCPECDYDGDSYDVVDVCACGNRAVAEPCGLCGAPLCPMCYEGGCGMCHRDHEKELRRAPKWGERPEPETPTQHDSHVIAWGAVEFRRQLERVFP